MSAGVGPLRLQPVHSLRVGRKAGVELAPPDYVTVSLYNATSPNRSTFILCLGGNPATDDFHLTMRTCNAQPIGRLECAGALGVDTPGAASRSLVGTLELSALRTGH